MIECPLSRYYLCHAVIALLIAAVVWPLLGLPAGLLAGAMFYIGREIAQYQMLKRMDWPGLIAPVSVCVAIFIIYKVIML